MIETTDQVITLKSKLAPPRLKDTVARERLYPLFDDIENNKAVTVTAGAGYGKTTFVAQACRARGVPTVWYRLDASDRDVIVFLNYLVSGIRQYYKGFGDVTLDLIRRSAEPLQTDSRQICTLLLHELENRLDRHLLIVLDDFHLIQESAQIRSVMQFLIQHLPHRLHLVLVSRSRPDLALSRLIAVREGFGITESDLAFTRTEIENLYRDIFDIPLDARALAVLEQKTGGWAVGLILFHYRLKKQLGTPIDRQFSFLTGDAGLFSNYLEENIFDLLPEPIASFLVRTSILSNLDVGLCNRLLGIQDARSILEQLEKMHLFTFAIDDAANTYQYHHLFRDYLRGKLNKTADPSTAEQLHRRAGQLLEARADIHGAVEHYFAAHAYDNAAALLVSKGSELIETGQLNQVLLFVERFPGHLVDSEPWLKYLLAYALFTKGDNRASLEAFDGALGMFQKMDDEDGAGRCMTMMATIYYLQDDFARAEAAFKQIIQRVPRDSEAHVMSLGNLIFISSRLLKTEQAEHYFQMATPILQQVNSPVADAWISVNYGFNCLSCGRYHEALQYGEKAESLTEQLNIFSLVVLSCHLISVAWWELDEFEKSLAAAEKGIHISEACGFRGPGYAWCLIDATFSALVLGRHAQGLAYSQKSLKTNTADQSDWTEAWTHLAHSRALFRNGDPDGAETAARKAFIIIERTPIPADKAKIQAHLAWVLLFQGQRDEAMAHMRAAEKRPGLLRFRRWISLFHAYCDFFAGRMEPALNRLQQILESAPNIEKDGLIMEHAQWAVPLLTALHEQGRCRDRIEIVLARFVPEHLKKIGPQPAGTGRPAHQRGRVTPDTSKSLRIHCLGQFRLWRGDVELTTQRWTSAKAKTLFKFLAFQARRGYQPKDRLLEMLWPDEDPEVTSKRLHVALTTIRKILEPDLPRRTASAYLLRDNDGYRLHLGDGGYLDLTAFDDALSAARQTAEPAAIETLLQAETLYQGDLFEEDPYLEWCAAEREQYREKYAWLLRQIADHYESAGKYDQSIDFLNRLLRLDEYDELIYCRLMNLHRKTGHRNRAVRIYEQCKQKLERELDCPLSEQTEQLYAEILSG